MHAGYQIAFADDFVKLAVKLLRISELPIMANQVRSRSSRKTGYWELYLEYGKSRFLQECRPFFRRFPSKPGIADRIGADPRLLASFRVSNFQFRVSNFVKVSA
jgi:hypothetical protein